MKLILILLFFIPFGAKAQTASDSLKYLYAQVSILKTMIGLNKAAADKRIKTLEDSMKLIRPLIFHVDDFIFNKGTTDTVRIKHQ